jgi:hypothetical protein
VEKVLAANDGLKRALTDLFQGQNRVGRGPVRMLRPLHESEVGPIAGLKSGAPLKRVSGKLVDEAKKCGKIKFLFKIIFIFINFYLNII